MSAIVLATLNARYCHCAFGLRYLLANMGTLQDQTALLEFTINQPILEILDVILAQKPRIVGLGVYIWNVDETTRLVADLKRVAPDVIVVLGGPEVSYETEQQSIVELADHVITGEADLAFASLCHELLAATPVSHCKSAELFAEATASTELVGGHLSDQRIIHAQIPDLNHLKPPYDLYTDHDIAQRVIYVEASRGCPYTCEFCLSALDIPVRQFQLEPFLNSMDQLIQRGVRSFKFVDRTFNLNIRVSRAILEFFLERYQDGMFLHFELIPDRLPEALKEIIAQFPSGAMQFEVGIQTFNDDVSALISRRQDNVQVEQNLSWLRENTSVHIHADLIVGLPGESLESFANGFDQLVKLAPHEIQVGILKRLRGTPIIRHDLDWQMVYSPHPPYEILSTRLMEFRTVQELRRFAKYWDAVANSGNFLETTALLWTPSEDELVPNEEAGQQIPSTRTRPTNRLSPFHEFQRLSQWLFAREGQSHGIALGRLVELLFEFMTQEKQLFPATVAACLWRDYQRGGRSDRPICLRPFLVDAQSASQALATRSIPKRQGRRLGVVNDGQQH